MTEEKKSRTPLDVKTEYTTHAVQLGEKIDLQQKIVDEMNHHRQKLKELREEFSLFTPAQVTSVEKSA